MDAELDVPPPDKISQILNNDLAGYGQLVDLLQQERRLLVDRDFDAFTQLLTKKHALLVALEQNNNQRLLALNTGGFAETKEGMQSLLNALAPEKVEHHQKDWADVLALITECAKLNDINARIAHRAQSTTHQILNILRGETAGFALYGRKGTPSASGNQLPITKA